MSFMFRDRKETDFDYSTSPKLSCTKSELVDKVHTFLRRMKVRGVNLALERDALMEFPPSVARDSAVSRCDALISFVDDVLEFFDHV